MRALAQLARVLSKPLPLADSLARFTGCTARVLLQSSLDGMGSLAVTAVVVWPLPARVDGACAHEQRACTPRPSRVHAGSRSPGPCCGGPVGGCLCVGLHPPQVHRRKRVRPRALKPHAVARARLPLPLALVPRKAQPAARGQADGRRRPVGWSDLAVETSARALPLAEGPRR